MYESHFGFTGAPFSLNPDPAFYFGSKGHSNALSYLKFGVYQGEGFVVVTGEIGAGKTTLVRTLLSELDKDKIVAAQIVSTQLEAGDLLRSVALAFGIAPKSLSKAELIATIEAFLTLLVTEERRALLIVDEAQNLNREAVEELRMLSNFQLGNQALLQSFLVGQPELRVLLTSKPMEQFRQRVIASCHLGPMDVSETRAYIEHRMHQVGWSGHPSFDNESFERIFHWSAGIPRRVNLLCNRVLLSAYLAAQTHIDAAAVDTIGEEVRGEVGDSAAKPVRAAAPAPAAAPVAPAPAPKRRAAVVEVDNEATLPVAVAATPSARAVQAWASVGSLMFVAATPSDDVKIAVLMQALKPRKTSAKCTRVRIGDASRFALNEPFLTQLGVDVPALQLEVSEASSTDRMAAVLRQFAPLVDDHRPSAIAVLGDSDVALACSLVAAKKHCRVVHIDAGARASMAGHGSNGMLIDRLAECFYACETSAYLALIREGVSEARVEHVGSLLVDAVRAALEFANSPEDVLRRSADQGLALHLERGYGLLALDDSIASGDAESITELLSSLHEISRDTLLVWPMHRAIAAKLEVLGLDTLARHERISIIEPLEYVDSIALLKAAAFVVTDAPDVRKQAAALQIRCLLVNERDGADAGQPHESPRQPEGAAQRIADHLAAWFESEPASPGR